MITMPSTNPHPLAARLVLAEIDDARRACAYVTDAISFALRVTNLSKKDYEAYITRNITFLAENEDTSKFTQFAGGCYSLIDKVESSMSAVAKLAEYKNVPQALDAPTRSMWKSHCIQGIYTPELASSLCRKLDEWKVAIAHCVEIINQADNSGEYSDISAYSSSDEEDSDDEENSSSSSD